MSTERKIGAELIADYGKESRANSHNAALGVISDRVHVLEYVTQEESGNMPYLSENFNSAIEILRDADKRATLNILKAIANPHFIPGIPLRNEGEISQLLQVFPDKRGETNRMKMKSVAFGTMSVEFFDNQDWFNSSFPKVELPTHTIMTIFPIGLASYSFDCTSYGNHQLRIGGLIIHVAINLGSRVSAKSTYLKGITKIVSQRIWDDQSIKSLTVLRRDAGQLIENAKVREFINKTDPYEGGRP